MTDLDGFDANQYPPLDSFEPLAEGEYLAVATDSEKKPTKAGTGEYLQFVWEIVEGPHEGRKLWSRLNLWNPSTTAVEIANRELSAICSATGVMRPKDSAEIHGIPVKLKVGLEKRKDTGELTNRIKGYEKAGTTQAPRPASAPSSTPPWKR